jgi:hypothetical protein
VADQLPINNLFAKGSLPVMTTVTNNPDLHRPRATVSALSPLLQSHSGRHSHQPTSSETDGDP